MSLKIPDGNSLNYMAHIYSVFCLYEIFHIFEENWEN